MNNKTQYRRFALKASPKWRLPASEEAEVEDRLCRALKDYATMVRKVFGHEPQVDWVVM